RTGALALLAASLGLLAAARAADVPLRAHRWIAPTADPAVLTRAPRERVREPRAPDQALLVEGGRAAFRPPVALGGQAPPAGRRRPRRRDRCDARRPWRPHRRGGDAPGRPGPAGGCRRTLRRSGARPPAHPLARRRRPARGHRREPARRRPRGRRSAGRLAPR